MQRLLLVVVLVVVVVPHAACGAMAALRQHKAKFVGVACGTSLGCEGHSNYTAIA